VDSQNSKRASAHRAVSINAHRRDGFSRTRSFFLRARHSPDVPAIVDGLVTGQPVKRLMIPAAQRV
jgi:hypothetical protein